MLFKTTVYYNGTESNVKNDGGFINDSVNI
jgi:hypothetical protein